MDDQDFAQKADAAIDALYRKLSDQVGDHDFDVDMNAGAMTVEFEEPRERFVLSPNAPVRQIWVSAHTSSFKLDWDAGREAFVWASSGETLEELMANAIAKRLGEDFSL